jgi:hypothetical protein
MVQLLSVLVVTLSLVTLLERLLLMSNLYLFTRGVVRGVFWGVVVIGSVLLIDWVGRELVPLLPY